MGPAAEHPVIGRPGISPADLCNPPGTGRSGRPSSLVLGFVINLRGFPHAEFLSHLSLPFSISDVKGQSSAQRALLIFKH